MTVRYAGVLPYAHDARTGRIAVLLGEEDGSGSDAGLWSDFGGIVDASDASVRDAAAREAYEESMGLLGASPAAIAERLSERRALDIWSPPRGPTDPGGRGRVYLLRMQWPPGAQWEAAFDGVRAYVMRAVAHAIRPEEHTASSSHPRQVAWPEGFMEKRRVRWVPLDDSTIQRVKMRSFFRDSTWPALRARAAAAIPRSSPTTLTGC